MLSRIDDRNDAIAVHQHVVRADIAVDKLPGQAVQDRQRIAHQVERCPDGLLAVRRLFGPRP